MGFSISPLIANLFMEELEVKALSTAPYPSTHLWLRFVDDIYVIQRQNTANNFFNTSTHKTLTYSSPWRNNPKMDHFHSLIHKFHKVPTTLSSLQSTKSPHIQINIYTGTVIISFGPNTVYSTHWHTGLQ